MNQNVKEILSKKGFQKISTGHPWLWKSDFNKNFRFPMQVGLYPIGEHWFLYSPQSDICFRRLGPATRLWPHGGLERMPIISMEDFQTKFYEPLKYLFRERYQTKKNLLNHETCFRWIFSENDFIPGLILDVYGTHVVAQLQTAPIDFFWPEIKQILLDVNPVSILELKNHALRKKEGLPIEEPKPSDPMEVYWNGLKWIFSPGGAQKTGTYLDQKETHLKTVEWAKKLNLKNAWDLFSFEGGFGLHLAKAGLSVISVDDSQSALETALKNAKLNAIPTSIYATLKQDVFIFLKEKFTNKEKTDLIVLDPPSFTKTSHQGNRALDGYKELNLRALHCIKPGGLLVSCACSHHISPEDFRHMLLEAAHDARRSVRILEVAGPSPDHAPLISFPEGNYLQAWFLQVG